MSNYTKERSRYGGFVGSIQIHSTPGLGIDNNPSNATFKDTLPAGFLRCDGSIRNASEFRALSEILGVGENCRFRKDNVTLREADPTTADFGQFQLPDLGSKVIIPGLGTGTYLGVNVGDTNETKVGPEIEVISNEGNTLRVDFSGNFTGVSQVGIDMRSTPKMNMPRNLEETFLDIQNFQGHAHFSNASYLNYSANHAVGGVGKQSGDARGNSGAGMILDNTNLSIGTTSSHAHRIQKPFSYTSNFQYQYSDFDISIDGVYSTLDVDINDDLKKLNQVVTPFILVEYIIKF